MKNNIDKYDEILFSFLYRDNVFPAVKKAKGFRLRGVVKMLFNSIKEDIFALFKNNLTSLENKTLLYVESLNQYQALKVLKDYPGVVFVTNSDKLICHVKETTIIKLNLSTKLKHRFKRVFYFSRYKSLFKSKFKDHLVTIIRYDGVYESLLDSINRYKPKAIVFSNDHNAFCRALLFAARDSGVKTIYIQHAAVTDQFPPLKFGLSLLEGEDSLKKYLKAGPIEGKVSLVGMPKFDKYYNYINKNDKIKSIGLALNNGDDFSAYFNLFNKIHNDFEKLEYHIRFHPSININNITIPSFFKISNTEKENSFEYLTKIDLLFAGNSSIHLEAALMNVPSIQVSFRKRIEKDYYGFLLNGLIIKIESNNVLTWLEQNINLKPNVRHKAKFYVNTINTKWDGQSLNLLKHELTQYLNSFT